MRLFDDNVLELKVALHQTHRHHLLVLDLPVLEQRVVVHKILLLLIFVRLVGQQRPVVEVAVDNEQVRQFVGDDRGIPDGIVSDESQLAKRLTGHFG